MTYTGHDWDGPIPDDMLPPGYVGAMTIPSRVVYAPESAGLPTHDRMALEQLARDGQTPELHACASIAGQYGYFVEKGWARHVGPWVWAITSAGRKFASPSVRADDLCEGDVISGCDVVRDVIVHPRHVAVVVRCENGEHVIRDFTNDHRVSILKG